MNPVPRSNHRNTGIVRSDDIVRSYDTAKLNFQNLASTANDVGYLLRLLLTIELAVTFVTRTFPSTSMLNIEPRTLPLIATHMGDACPFHLSEIQQLPDFRLT
jgi:hypothetical protein